MQNPSTNSSKTAFADIINRKRGSEQSDRLRVLESQHSGASRSINAQSLGPPTFHSKQRRLIVPIETNCDEDDENLESPLNNSGHF